MTPGIEFNPIFFSSPYRCHFFKVAISVSSRLNPRTPLEVQWLRLQALNAGGPRFDPWSGNQILCAATKDLAQQNRKQKDCIPYPSLVLPSHLCCDYMFTCWPSPPIEVPECRHGLFICAASVPQESAHKFYKYSLKNYLQGNLL